MNSVLEQGDWRSIDETAKRRSKVFVRSGPSYAWARWSGTNRNWVYYVPGTNDALDFVPTEYRFD